MNNTPQHPYAYRSLFWPVVFISVGAVWLLSNLGFVTLVNLNVLAQLWPLLLIGIGLDIVIGRRAPVIGALIALLLVGAALLLMTALPASGLIPAAVVKTDTLRAPLDDATAAQINLNLSTPRTNITALEDSDELIVARVDYTGEIDLNVTGGATREVRLRHRGAAGVWIAPDDERSWDIALSPRVPIDLLLDTSTGVSDVDLTALQLKSLEIDGSTGAMTLKLPAAPQHYDATIDVSTGAMDVKVPRGAQTTIYLSMSTGAVTIDVPEDGGVQVRVEDDSIGSVQVPLTFMRTQEGKGDRGTWESANYAATPHKITIVVTDMSTGKLTVRRY